MGDKLTVLDGRIVAREDGYWLEFFLEGELYQHGPHPTLESARGAVKIVLASATKAYEEEGYPVRQFMRERGGTA